MTKAERIYGATRSECKRHIENWGYTTNPDGTAIGFASVICLDDESVCTRTLNEIEKILLKKRKMESQFFGAGIHDAEKNQKETQIMNMIGTTIMNNRKALEALMH